VDPVDLDPDSASDVGVPSVTGVISGFSIHAVVRHSAVDTGGKFAVVVVATGSNMLPLSTTPVVNENLRKL
jgi:hypothetical protein